jgi:hypothetical protein
VAVFEELLLPAVEQVGSDAELIAEIGDRSFLEEVAFEDGDLLGAGKVAACSWETSVQVMLTRTVASSRFN